MSSQSHQDLNSYQTLGPSISVTRNLAHGHSDDLLHSNNPNVSPTDHLTSIPVDLLVLHVESFDERIQWHALSEPATKIRTVLSSETDEYQSERPSHDGHCITAVDEYHHRYSPTRSAVSIEYDEQIFIVVLGGPSSSEAIVASG